MGASVQTQNLQMRTSYAEGKLDGIESLLQRGLGGIGGVFNNPSAFFNRMSCGFLSHSCCGMPSIFGGGFNRFMPFVV